jgi:histidine triad (HIT) family protein
MTDCLFCKIINDDIPAEIAYQDDTVLAFNDIDPKAPTHILIIPKKHISTLNDLTDSDTHIVGHMVQIAQKIAKDLHHDTDGYRIVMNCNEHGGQTVFHIHLHLLAGRNLTWPPG